MPYIMDQDLEDLFGEGPPLQLPEPIHRGLPQRVDELSTGGCHQYVSRPIAAKKNLKYWPERSSGLIMAALRISV